MSMGFGFSLPAYPLRGGGGNNPFNQSGPTLDLSFTGNAGNLSGADTYTLDTNFITPQYQVAAQYAVWVDGSGMTQRNFADIVTFSRGTAATQFDSTGTLIYAPMNAIRNNMMVGAVAGTPGTLPTNWGTFTTLTGITTSVVGTGTENGITYIDFRLSGTPSASGGFDIYPETSNGVSALTGQTWSQAQYVRLAAGTTAGVTSVTPFLAENTSAGVFVRSNSGTPFTPASTALNINRITQTATLSGGATVGAVRPGLFISLTGAAIDITLRIGMPQLERGSTATAVNATSGTAYYGPRFDYNPSTLAAQGLLIEEQRTNSIRNNTMQGAVAGTPGTLPTNYARDASTTGLSSEVVGTGTDGGIAYIDFRVFGTAAAANYYAVFFETATQVAAATGQTWTNSFYMKLAAGSTAGLSTNPGACMNEVTSAGVYVTGQEGLGVNPTSNWQRVSLTRTLNGGATVAGVHPFVLFRVNNGAAINITLRIGLPQLEQGAFATSVIPTTTTALTRSADVASVNTLSPWFNSTQGTLFAQGILVGGTAGNFPFQATLAGSNPNTDVIGINWGAASTQMRGVIRVSNVNTMDLPAGPAKVAGNSFRSAIAYQLNNSNFATDGTVALDDTVVTLPAVQNLLIGGPAVFQTGASSWVQRITYYPRRLPNADLQTITA